jgi:hypothetical protein
MCVACAYVCVVWHKHDHKERVRETGAERQKEGGQLSESSGKLEGNVKGQRALQARSVQGKALKDTCSRNGRGRPRLTRFLEQGGGAVVCHFDTGEDGCECYQAYHE